MNTNRKTLAKTAILLCVGVAALGLGSAVDGKTTAPSARALVVTLNEKHASGVSGMARLTAVGNRVRVVLQLSGPSVDGLPAHIHTGPCRREPTFANPRIWSSLNTVVRGRSVTVVRTTLRRLRAASFSINVHDPGTLGVIACGDIKRVS